MVFSECFHQRERGEAKSFFGGGVVKECKFQIISWNMKFVHVIYHLHPKKKKKKEGVQGNIESKYYTIFAALRPLR